MLCFGCIYKVPLLSNINFLKKKKNPLQRTNALFMNSKTDLRMMHNPNSAAPTLFFAEHFMGITRSVAQQHWPIEVGCQEFQPVLENHAEVLVQLIQEKDPLLKDADTSRSESARIIKTSIRSRVLISHPIPIANLLECALELRTDRCRPIASRVLRLNGDVISSFFFSFFLSAFLFSCPISWSLNE